MNVPIWLSYAIAVLMVSISVYCALRIALARQMGRRNHDDVNVAHLFMGLAMAGMFVPRWRLLPVGAWEVVFAVAGTYFLVLSARCVARGDQTSGDDDHGRHVSHSAVHLVMTGAMFYMLWLTTSMTISVSAPPRGVRDPTFTLALVVVLVGALIWQLDAVGRFALQRQRSLAAGVSGVPIGDLDAEPATSLPWLAPRLEIASDVAMCLAMGYMLVLMM